MQKIVRRNMYGHVLRAMKKIDGGRVLDAGCGYGFFLSALEDNWEKYGNEQEDYIVNYVKEKYPAMHIKKGNLIEDLYKKDFFDVIFSSMVFEHIEEDPKIVIR